MSRAHHTRSANNGARSSTADSEVGKKRTHVDADGGIRTDRGRRNRKVVNYHERSGSDDDGDGDEDEDYDDDGGDYDVDDDDGDDDDDDYDDDDGAVDEVVHTTFHSLFYLRYIQYTFPQLNLP